MSSRRICAVRTGGRKGGRRLVLAGLALLLLALPSCGYRLRGDPGSRYFSSDLRVELRPFANASLVPDAGAHLVGRLREEMRRGGFRGRFDNRNADFLVEGKIRDVLEEPISHGADGLALEHRLSLLVDIRVIELLHGRLLWKEEGLVETASYFAGADFQYTEANRRMAFEEVSRRMARRIGQTLRVLW